jgi:hypothetical protein
VSLDGKIDDLYRQPLDAFVTARNALAKTLTGDEAKRVRGLVKPTVVPWAVNQVYWQARQTYDKLIKSGERLRGAQIASLEGRRGADVREAGDAHRSALAEAVKAAERIAADADANPPTDTLMRTFETLSLASQPPEPPGRLTKPLQPSGFEALAGVTPSLKRETREGGQIREGGSGRVASRSPETARSESDRRKERAAEEAARKREAAISAAAAAVARAEAAEQLARTAWERSHDKLLEARQVLTQLKSSKSEV